MKRNLLMIVAAGALAAFAIPASAAGLSPAGGHDANYASPADQVATGTSQNLVIPGAVVASENAKGPLSASGSDRD